QSTNTVDSMYGQLNQTDYGYDEGAAPQISTRANLDTSMGNTRGNATTVTTYELGGTNRTFSTATTYWDTGDVHEVTDARVSCPDAPSALCKTTFQIDPNLCTAAATLSSTVTNALGHQKKTVADCFTGAVLSVADANGVLS